MRWTFLAVLMFATRPGWALSVCSDPSAVVAARAQIDADCDCVGASTHAAFTGCAARIVRQRIAAGTLQKACRRYVRQCAQHSTCGRPGRVACCLGGTGGPARCAIRKAAACDGCAASVTSCCDACGELGCLATTTTAPTTTTSTTIATGRCGNGVIDPGEMCDGESFCGANCTVPLEACCVLPGSDTCTVGCTPIGMSCYLACGANNPAYVGRHPVWTAACPGAPGNAYVGQGTCEGTPIPITSVCCPLAAGGCTTTVASNSEDLQIAILDCAIQQGTINPVIGQCVGGTCVPAH